MEKGIQVKDVLMMKRTEMSMHQFRVAKFMSLARQELPYVPMVPVESIRRLRAALILEEALETVKALGFDAHVFPGGNNKHIVQLHPHDQGCDIVEVIDGCCDVAVVTTGTLCAFGVGDCTPQLLVDQNNLDKFGPGHSYRADGKLIKPPDHKPPALMSELVRQGYCP